MKTFSFTMRFRPRIFFALLLALAPGADTAVRAQVGTDSSAPAPLLSFSIQEMGTLFGGFRSEGLAINDLGQVAGWATNRLKMKRAVLFDPTPLRPKNDDPLRELGGTLETVPKGDSLAFGINFSGEIVGQGTTDDGTMHAFLWSRSAGMTDLKVLPGKTDSAARGINDSGIVIGWSGDGSQRAAFVYRRNLPDSQKLTALGIPDKDYWCQPFAINNRNEIVGECDPFDRRIQTQLELTPLTGRDPEGYAPPQVLSELGSTIVSSNLSKEVLATAGRVVRAPHGFLWTPGKPLASDTKRAIIDTFIARGTYRSLGSLGGSYTGGFAISGNGWVVGASRPDTGSAIHAFLWNERQHTFLIDLGTLGGESSQAFGVDNNARVVGWALTATGEKHAFLSQRDPKSGNWIMRDLNTLIPATLRGDWVLAEARGINAQGQIVGWGWQRRRDPDNGKLVLVERGFLLNPG